MIPETFATHSLPAVEQFEAWRSWYGPVFDSTPRRPVEEGFRGKAVSWLLNGLTFSHVSAQAVDNARTRTHIRRSPVDHWVVTSYTRGTTRIGMRGTSLETFPGAPFIVSLAEEVTAERSNDNDRIQLHLSRDGFQEIAAMLDATQGMNLNTPQGKLLADYMLLLERNLPDLAPEDGPRLCNAVKAMLEACLAPSDGRLMVAASQVNVTLMERVRRVVGKHLRSPSFGPDKLCREAATSRSQLYRLLEGEGGVARYIRRRRLSESFAILCDASNNLAVGSIAEMFCFADTSSFSRAFRREFGASPGDVRAASSCGLRPAMPPVGREQNVNTFADCLRSY
jgi:AraC-like DNA-binding protein